MLLLIWHFLIEAFSFPLLSKPSSQSYPKFSGSFNDKNVNNGNNKQVRQSGHFPFLIKDAQEVIH